MLWFTGIYTNVGAPPAVPLNPQVDDGREWYRLGDKDGVVPPPTDLDELEGGGDGGGGGGGGDDGSSVASGGSKATVASKDSSVFSRLTGGSKEASTIERGEVRE